MKNIKNLLSVLICTTLLFNCKKKEDTPQEQPQQNNPSTTGSNPVVHVNKLTAKLNGQDWSMVSNGYFYSLSGHFLFGGQNSTNIPFSSVEFKSTTTYLNPGVFNLSSSSNDIIAKYKDLNNNYFTSKTGTINITAFDTVGNGFLKKCQATFSFKTDTINNVSYDVTEGLIDFIKP